MSIYRYPQSKIIDEVTFRESDRGALRAYLHAPDGVGYEVLEPINVTLIAKGFKCVPQIFNGKPVLEIRKFSKRSDLLELLEQNGWITGKSEYIKEKGDDVPFWERLKRRTLQLTGLFFIAADIGYMKYGQEEKRWEDVAGGFSYLLGSSEFAAFGHADQSDLQIRNNVRKILEYAKEHGLAFDKHDAISNISEDKPRGTANSVYEILKNYPGEVGNSLTALAGAFIASSALRHRVLKKFDPVTEGTKAIADMKAIGRSTAGMKAAKVGEEAIAKKKFAGGMDIGLGVTTLLSGLLGGWVKEKASDPDKSKATGIAGILEWVQEKPLRISGFGYMISTACHAFSTFIEYREAKKYNDKKALRAIPWRASFITFTIIGEILMTLSSKGHGEGVKSDKSLDDTMIAVTAELIAKQPKAMQETLINNLAQFLGRPDVLARKNDEVVQLLREQVRAICINPWAMPTKRESNHTQPTEAPCVPMSEKAKTYAVGLKSAEPWQAKVAASKPEAPTLSA